MVGVTIKRRELKVTEFLVQQIIFLLLYLHIRCQWRFLPCVLLLPNFVGFDEKVYKVVVI